MNFEQLERAVSVPRLNRYLSACNFSKPQAVKLYFFNSKTSSELFQTIGMLEVVLRNAIDRFYRIRFGDEWLLSQSNPSGYLSQRGCQNSRKSVQEAISKLGEFYAHDKTVASLSFAFWRYCFSGVEFAAAGDSLLKIFPKRPSGVNQKQVFKLLTEINQSRNRIAHHEPICFEKGIFSILEIQKAHQNCRTIFEWLALDERLLGGSYPQKATLF